MNYYVLYIKENIENLQEWSYITEGLINIKNLTILHCKK